MTNRWNSHSRAQLRRFVAEKFTVDELKDLAFDLGVDFELFENNTKSSITRRLIEFFENRNRLNELITEIIKQRPNSDLIDLLTSFQEPTISKIQIIISDDLIENEIELKHEMAERFNVHLNDVLLIGVARGSTRILLGLPQSSINQNFPVSHSPSSTRDFKYFYELNILDRERWRFVAINFPPLRVGLALVPNIAWSSNNFTNPSKLNTSFKKLIEQICENFSLEELRNICYSLQVDYYNLPGVVCRTKAEFLIRNLYTQGRLGDLIEECKILRPKFDWNNPIEEG